MKFVVKSLKPRNPLVALSLARKAGVHRPGTRSRRRLVEVALQREADQWLKSSP